MRSESDLTLGPEKLSCNASFPTEQCLDFSGITHDSYQCTYRSWKQIKPGWVFCLTLLAARIFIFQYQG